MINIADKYGLRDIMNGTLYSIDKEGLPVKPVLFLDTLKVSTIETHCETTLAEGGKGYAPLISWDYQRDITINLTDALFSVKSLSCLSGAFIETEGNVIRKAIPFRGTTIPVVFKGPNNKSYFVPSTRTIYDIYGNKVSSTDLIDKNDYLCCFNLTPRTYQGLEIKSNIYSGLYYFTGDVCARDLETNKDLPCQFIIPKMKITSNFDFSFGGTEATIFNFTARALTQRDGRMMSLVQYTINEPGGEPLQTINGEDIFDIIDRRLLGRWKEGQLSW